MENENKEVENIEGVCSTSSVSIVELIKIETSVSNSFMGFHIRKILSKWNAILST